MLDLDGLLIQTEEIWDDVREAFARERGARYDAAAQRAMMGMSSLEWSRYMHDELGVPDAPREISAEVVRRMDARYRQRLPLLPGAVEAVERLAARWPLALASSSNRPLIDTVLERSRLDRFFRATVSSEEVPRGKPAPDVYLEAARRLGVEAGACVAIEDSHSGIRSAHAAGMAVVALPNRSYPPGGEALAAADLVVETLDDITPDAIERLSR